MFLVIEGPDGAGKSTQVQRLAAALRARGVAVDVVREPGGTRLGERVRAVLLEPEGAPVIDGRAELFLFLASRAQLCAEVIRPALAAGRWVLADRFYASTAVYQGGLEAGLGIEKVIELSLTATRGLRPDRTFILDLPAPLAHARAAERADGDRLDRRPLEAFERVAEGYKRYAALAPEPVEVVAADRSVDAIAEDLLARILRIAKRDEPGLEHARAAAAEGAA